MKRMAKLPFKELQISYNVCIRSQHSPRSLSGSFLGRTDSHNLTSTLAHSFFFPTHVDREASFFPSPSFPAFCRSNTTPFLRQHLIKKYTQQPCFSHRLSCSPSPWVSVLIASVTVIMPVEGTLDQGEVVEEVKGHLAKLRQQIAVPSPLAAPPQHQQPHPLRPPALAALS